MENSEQLMKDKKYYTHKFGDISIEQAILFAAKIDTKESILADEQRYIQAELYLLIGDFEASSFKFSLIEEPLLYGWGQYHIAEYEKMETKRKEAIKRLESFKPTSSMLEMERYLLLHQLYSHEDIKKCVENVENMYKTDILYPNVFEIAREFYQKNNNVEGECKVLLLRLEKKFSHTLFEELFSKIELIFKNSELSPLLERIVQLVILNDRENFLDKIHKFEELYKDNKKRLFSFFLFIMNLIIKHKRQFKGRIDEKEAFWIVEKIDLLLMNNPKSQAVWKVINQLNQFKIPDFLKHYLNTLKIVNNGVRKNNIEFSFDSFKWYQFIQLQVIYSRIIEISKQLCIQMNECNWWGRYYFKDNSQKILIAGVFSSGKSSFINSFLPEPKMAVSVLPTTSVITVIENDSSEKYIEIGSNIKQHSFKEFSENTTINHMESSKLKVQIFNLRTPAKLLKENNIILIDSPGFNDQKENSSNPTFDYLQIADQMVFVFNATNAFTKKEKEILMKIHEIAPDLPIKFVINQFDLLEDEDQEEVLENTAKNLKKIFGGKVKIEGYSSIYKEILSPSKLIDNLELKKINVEKHYLKIPLYQKVLNQMSVNITNEVSKLRSNLNNKVIFFRDQLKYVDDCKHNIIDSKIEEFIQTSNKEGKKVFEQILSKECQKQIYSIINNVIHKIPTDIQEEEIFKVFNDQTNIEFENYLKQDLLFQCKSKFEMWIKKQKIIMKNNINQINNELEDISLNILSDLDPKVKIDLTIFEKQIINYLDEKIKNVEYTPIKTTMHKSLPIMITINSFFSKIKKEDTRRFDQYIDILQKEDYSVVFLHISSFVRTLSEQINQYLVEQMLEFQKLIDKNLDQLKNEQSIKMGKCGMKLKNIIKEEQNVKNLAEFINIKVEQLAVLEKDWKTI